jgi:hypothetical protein
MEGAMPILPYLSGTFEPEHIDAMSLAFQEVCEALEIGPRATREREVIAVRKLARRGEQSPRRLISRVLEEAGVGRRWA